MRRKIDGWYSKEEHYVSAVDRIVRQREEFIDLLESVQKVDTRKLIAYLDKVGVEWCKDFDWNMCVGMIHTYRGDNYVNTDGELLRPWPKAKRNR